MLTLCRGLAEPLLREAALRAAACASQQLVSLRSFGFGSAASEARRPGGSPFSSTATAAAAPAATSPRHSSLLLLHPASQSQASLQEGIRLGESLAGESPDHVTVGSARRLRASPATFFGSGQVEALLAHIHATNPQRVFVNHALSGVQQRNLERVWGRPVLDRVALIIEIFSQRARTAEARLQVELASLDYAASRLVRVVDAASGRRTAFGLDGDTEVVSARERGRSGSVAGGLGGAGGQGESELQLQRRRGSDRRKQLQRRLEQVRKTRGVQRAARQRSGKPQIAIVGYTNAGKSSLLRALSKCGDVGVEDRLFATLDPTLRRVMLPGSGRDAILSDTVGFISDLPTQLIEAFKATLEEVTEADLLLHVLDASSPQVLEQRAAVLRVLHDLGVSQQRLEECVVEVWNKTDQLAPAAAVVEEAAAAGVAPADTTTTSSSSSGSSGSRQDQLAPAAADLEAAAAGVAPAATSSSSSGDSRADGGSNEGGTGVGSRVQLAAAGGLLPPALEALLAGHAAAAAYRPTAVATSVLRGQGLDEVLSTVEAKLQAVLGSRQQVSRRSVKREAAETWRQEEGSQ